MYGMTTEDISSYLPNLGVNGRKCLTVLASGDQLLNLYALGAASVTCFDVVPEAAIIAELKIQALLQLEYNEFLRLFSRYPTDLLNRAATYLPRDKRRWVQQQHAERGPVGMRLWLGGGGIGASADWVRWNPYLRSEEDYLRTRDVVLRRNRTGSHLAGGVGALSFVPADVMDLACTNIVGRFGFDCVLLSNIAEHTVERMVGQQALVASSLGVPTGPTLSVSEGAALLDPFRTQVRSATSKRFAEEVIWRLASGLTAGGVMLAEYIYGGADPHRSGGCQCGHRNGPAIHACPDHRRIIYAPRPGYAVEEFTCGPCFEPHANRYGADIAVVIRRTSSVLTAAA